MIGGSEEQIHHVDDVAVALAVEGLVAAGNRDASARVGAFHFKAFRLAVHVAFKGIIAFETGLGYLRLGHGLMAVSSADGLFLQLDLCAADRLAVDAVQYVPGDDDPGGAFHGGLLVLDGA